MVKALLLAHSLERGKDNAMRLPYRAFVALVRAATYSVRQPQTYQVSASFPIPQPSTLASSLACAAALADGGPEGVLGDAYVEQLAKSILEVLVRATAKPVAPLTSSSVTVSRVRTLESSSEEVVKSVEEGRRISDAMVREYYRRSISSYLHIQGYHRCVESALLALLNW
jgi:CRISPR-associated protein Cas5 subtype I-A